jgi:hypothetical protein
MYVVGTDQPTAILILNLLLQFKSLNNESREKWRSAKKIGIIEWGARSVPSGITLKT